MADAKTYAGSCHCGRVRYDATADLSQMLQCNCSHCQRKGFLLTFIPPGDFTLKAGESDLTEYRFNQNVIQHLFCRHCGVEPFARGQMPDGSPVVAVNVRCLEGVDLEQLQPTPFDGRSI